MRNATASADEAAPEAPPFRPIAELVAEHARNAPRAAAIVDAAGTLDYAAFDALIDRVAAALQRDGIAPGEAVAICAASSARYAAIFLGALRAGVALAPLSPSVLPSTFDAMLRDSGARLLFIDEQSAALMGEPGARPALVALQSGLTGTPFEAWLAPAGSTPLRVAIQLDMPFNIIYSSGTTGTPKGIVQSHGMRWAQVSAARPIGYGPDAVTMLATPLYSNTTLVAFFPTLAWAAASC